MQSFNVTLSLLKKAYFVFIRFLVRHWHVSPISTVNHLDVDRYARIAADVNEFRLPSSSRDAFFADIDQYIRLAMSKRTQLSLIDAMLLTFHRPTFLNGELSHLIEERPMVEVLIRNYTAYVVLFHAYRATQPAEIYHRKVYSWRDGMNRRARYLGNSIGDSIRPIGKNDRDFIFDPNQPTLAYKEHIGPDHPLYRWCTDNRQPDLFNSPDTHTEG